MAVHFAEIVDWNALRDTILGALAAGFGITAAYGFVLLGGVRAREHYGEGRMPQAILYGLIGVAGLAVSATGITLGLVAVSE